MQTLLVQEHNRAQPAVDLALKRSSQNNEQITERRAGSQLFEKAALALKHILYALPFPCIMASMQLLADRFAGAWQVDTRLLKLGDTCA
jgi:hypothetical protein